MEDMTQENQIVPEQETDGSALEALLAGKAGFVSTEEITRTAHENLGALKGLYRQQLGFTVE
ncbi:hypothetical protein [Rufibacter soli]